MSEYLYEVAKRLIEFDTVSAKSNLAAMDYLSHELAAAKFKTALQTIQIAGVEQANLVAWAGPSRPDGLIVSGHMDTVPFESQPGWTRDALRLEVEGARIFGRGTSDMKGFIAECADAARRSRSGQARTAVGVCVHSQRGSGLPGRRENRSRIGAIPRRNAGAAPGMDRRADLMAGQPRAQKYRAVRRDGARRWRSQRSAQRRASTRSP